jgi:hypothetical protein
LILKKDRSAKGRTVFFPHMDLLTKPHSAYLGSDSTFLAEGATSTEQLAPYARPRLPLAARGYCFNFRLLALSCGIPSNLPTNSL